ncbi:MAG: PIG-L family deacetylase [Candidatus Saccharimonas sp.]|jgi:LmbE family N-acetylglucosaminyl deacetylase|nr:PIG-L family deacetylase [Candidatus Saccharimonas sp.]
MKKVIFGIFAHPDDEAFGCSPTLIKEVADGNEVHLITLTAGENGCNPDSHDNLGDIRLVEWRRGGEIIGAKSMHYLGYEDGTLNNLALASAASQIRMIIEPIILENTSSIEFMSFDFNGISGHIDHIVASRAAALAFYQLKDVYPNRLTKLRLRCVPRKFLPEHNIDWLYMEAGREDKEIDETVDAQKYHSAIIEVIRAHHSQRGDGEAHIARFGKDIGLNYFMIIE